MDNKTLMEMRKDLAMLPVLTERLNRLHKDIAEEEENVSILLNKYHSESLDVEQLKKESLSSTILKLLRKYDGKLTKETQEMLAAKMEYDKALSRVKELYAERDEIKKRIAELIKTKRIYEAEIRKRELNIKNNINDETSVKYNKLVSEQNLLSKQLIEIDEAIRAAGKVIKTAGLAAQHLKSAEEWATFDIWARGGIISHMAKYEHIDNAQADFNRMNSQIKNLNKELLDINLPDKLRLNIKGIDITTRTIDFWFDNIFTDLSVRDRIKEDSERLKKLYEELNEIINKLIESKSAVQKRIDDIETQKSELIISEE